MTQQEQQNVQAVQRLYDAFGRGDIQTILDGLAEDVEWHEAPGGFPPFRGTYRGREAMSEFFRQLGETAEVERFEPKEFLAQGDTVVALGSYTFRSRAHGRPWDTDWAMVWRLRDGRVARFQILKDTATENAALTG